MLLFNRKIGDCKHTNKKNDTGCGNMLFGILLLRHEFCNNEKVDLKINAKCIIVYLLKALPKRLLFLCKGGARH